MRGTTSEGEPHHKGIYGQHADDNPKSELSPKFFFGVSLTVKHGRMNQLFLQVVSVHYYLNLRIDNA